VYMTGPGPVAPGAEDSREARSFSTRTGNKRAVSDISKMAGKHSRNMAHRDADDADNKTTRFAGGSSQE
jgi:hypothetical protein